MANRSTKSPAIVGIAALVVLSCACAPASRPPRVTAVVGPSWDPRLAEANALMAEGCLDCLFDASKIFAAVGQASGDTRACAGQYQAELLLDLHERLLGLPDGGHLAIGEGLSCRAEFPVVADIVRVIPRRLGSVGERGATEEQVTLLEQLAPHRAEWTAFLANNRTATLLHATLALRFECAHGRRGAEEVIDPGSPLYAAGAVRFTRATCRGVDGPALMKLVSEQPRFAEAGYFSALLDLQNSESEKAAQKLVDALGWRPEWPAALFAQGTAFMALEQYPEAVTSFEKTRRLLPEDGTTMLQEIIALSYAGMHEGAQAGAAALALRNQWHVGEALYWKAWNEARLGDLNTAWASVRAAQAQLSNADVAKLAGLIAARRSDLPTAAFEFGVARARNPADCDSHDALSLVQLELRQWTQAGATLGDVLECLQREDVELEKLAVDLAAKGRNQAASRRRAQVAANASTRAKSWYNNAVVAYNLGKKDEAREWASRVPPDSAFGKRAQDLLRQIGLRL